jgi:C4-dicarboxylate transporter DctQ subunit
MIGNKGDTRLNILKKVDYTIARIEEFIIASSVIVMSIVLIGNVFQRSIMNDSWTFADEVGRFLVIIVTFIGSSYAARQGRHIRMSAIYDMMPKKVRKALMILITGLTSVVLLIIAYYALRYTAFIFDNGRVSNALQLPMYYIYIFVPVGLVLTSIQYMLTMIINILNEEIYISTTKNDSEVV